MASVPDTLTYGPILGVVNIDRAMIALLKKWMPSYLHEVARQNGEAFERLRPPRSYRTGPEVEFLSEDQRPACIVVCDGPQELPVKYGRGPNEIGQIVQGTWRYQVAFNVVAQGKKNVSIPRAHELVMMYCAAARVLLDQQQEDIEYMVDVMGEEPGGLEPEADRTAALGIVSMDITIPTIHVKGIGPSVPDQPPDVEPPAPDSPILPTVQTTDLDLTKYPTDQPFPGGE